MQPESKSSPNSGPSRLRPPPIPIPARQKHLAPTSSVRTRTPTRASTHDHEVELGVYIASGRPMGPSCSVLPSLSPLNTGFSFGKRPSISSASGPAKIKSLFLTQSEWRTDIVTFCSHARVDSTLGQARISHIQARKSRRPPFLHEYLLVFFTTYDGQRLVARIDRLGKIGSTQSGGLLGWFTGPHGRAANTAVQQVGVYHIQDSALGVDSPHAAWSAYDGRWGSDPIATLVSWRDIGSTNHASHQLRVATVCDGPAPQLGDASRLLEAILLEMPTYHLTTTNCYFMTRTSLLLLQRCFPRSFACFLGSASGDLIPGSELAEPVWAGLLRWYLPFVIAMFVVYFPLLIVGHYVTFNLLACHALKCPIYTELVGPNPDSIGYGVRTSLSRVAQGIRLSVHGLFAVPLPVGILHAYMTALEVEMNEIVTRISTEFHNIGRADYRGALLAEPQPFSVPFEQAWHTFLAWCVVGVAIALVIFIAMVSHPWVLFGMFMLLVVWGIWYNFDSPDGDILADAENMFRVPELEANPQKTVQDELASPTLQSAALFA